MMIGTGNDYRGQVLAATDIVELIGRTVALKRRGRNYIGLCPFHQEKTPSFNVKPEKQYFYCFGCKASGTAIDFVMKRDRVEFLDALRLLGEQAGIEMPQFGGSPQKSGEKQVLLDMQSAACAFFEKLLSHPEQGLAARQYLEQRRIDAESIKRFQIGLAVDSWDAMLRALGRKFTAAQLEQGGLAKPRQNGQGYYDTFRNRLMFPIRDENSRIIAFGGRVMPGSQDAAKYLNSPETPLFSKSRSIFGIDLARQKMVESRTAVVVEGYTDVIVAHQFGISNVVSVLGTAMTEQHVSMLRRFVDRIVLLFDADAAGDNAVDRALAVFLGQPVEIAIATMPPGLDPDEFVLDRGAEAFQGVADSAVDALSYKWKQLARDFEASDQNLTGQQKAVEAYLEVLGSARGAGPVDAIRWGQALSRVHRLTGIPVEDLNRRFKPRRQPTASSPIPGPAAAQFAPAEPARVTAQDRAERWILGILLLEPHRWHEAQQGVHLEDFANERHRRLAEKYWNHQRDEGEPVFNQFLASLEEAELVELAVTAVEEVEALPDVQQVLQEAAAYFERTRRVRDEQKLVASSQRKELDEVELLRKLSEKRRKADLWRT
ncbi:MAG TPA: DNA primase [Tepidisphaeraceae bacterium]|jgi:DNA primase|nr:DNA primase [Tepidisphaeraceae bacterium]